MLGYFKENWMKKRSYLSIILIALIGITAGYSQDYSKKLEKAAQLHKNYSFSEAAQIYKDILQGRPDPTLATQADSALNMDLHSRAIACENGENLLKFGSSPVLVAKKTFPLTFFDCITLLQRLRMKYVRFCRSMTAVVNRHLKSPAVCTVKG